MSIHWRLRQLYFNIDPSPEHPVIFLGDSITYGGDSTRAMLRRLDHVIALKPSQIFLMIGTNALCYTRKIPDIIVNYRLILGRLRNELPDTAIYVQSGLPFNDEIFPARKLRNNANIAALNVEIRKLAAESELPYIDLAPAFTGPGGRLPAEYTEDYLHLSEAAYLIWRDHIKHLVATGRKICLSGLHRPMQAFSHSLRQNFAFPSRRCYNAVDTGRSVADPWGGSSWTTSSPPKTWANAMANCGRSKASPSPSAKENAAAFSATTAPANRPPCG